MRCTKYRGFVAEPALVLVCLALAVSGCGGGGALNATTDTLDAYGGTDAEVALDQLSDAMPDVAEEVGQEAWPDAWELGGDTAEDGDAEAGGPGELVDAGEVGEVEDGGEVGEVEDGYVADGEIQGDKGEDGVLACPGAPLCECASGMDCDSGFCVDTLKGKRCSLECETSDDCPDGWQCLLFQGSMVCQPPSLLCAPCSQDGDCQPEGGAGGKCVDFQGSGTFCGVDCDADQDCIEGFSCVEVDLGERGTVKQCVPEDWQCPCTDEFKGVVITCYVENEYGRCYGERTCDSECDAPTPEMESCNGEDDDCDGETDEADAEGCTVYYADKDGDGYGAADDSQCLCSAVAPYENETGEDCDDSSAEINPEATEKCNGVDDNCDGQTDEDWPNLGQECVVGQGECENTGTYQCMASGAGVYCDAVPKDSTAEVCDGKDNDCDGQTDEGEDSNGCVAYYRDGDGDGYGDALDSKCLCTASGAYSTTQPGDCDDSRSEAYPGAKEVCNDMDDDCDTKADEDFEGKGDACDGPDSDLCKEGQWVCSEDGTQLVCSDQTGGLVEKCNGIDDDCDGQTDEHWPILGQQCTVGIGECQASGTYKCKADGTGVYCDAVPGQQKEEVCDNLDNDCDGQTDEHWPKKGEPCDGPDEDLCKEGEFVCSEDGLAVVCSDNTASNVEICKNNKDDDCDGNTDENEENAEGCTDYYYDYDGDGYGVITDTKCLCAPLGLHRATKSGDCCDKDANANPGQTDFFATKDTCGNFDYDCNLQEEQEWPNTGQCDKQGNECNLLDGWVFEVPNCGESGSFITQCSLVGEFCQPANTKTQVQRCR